MSIEQKILYAGLKRMTDDRAVIKNAYHFWQVNLSENQFDIVEVTGRLVAFLGLNSTEKKTLMIAMHAASSKSEMELDDVPGFLTGETGAPENDAPKVEKVSSTPHYQITVGYIKGLIDGIRSFSPASFTEIDEILRDEGLSDVKGKINQQILQNGFSNNILSSSISEDECRDLAHQLYLLVIDVIGPVDADVIVNRVIGALMQSEMSSRFDPRSFL